MLYGLRGVGKTVLLNEVERIGEGLGYAVEHLEMSETDDFRRVIAKSTRKVLLGISTVENLKDKSRKALGILKAFTIAIPNGPELRIEWMPSSARAILATSSRTSRTCWWRSVRQRRRLTSLCVSSWMKSSISMRRRFRASWLPAIGLHRRDYP